MTLPFPAGQIMSLQSPVTTLYWSMHGCEIAAGVPQYKTLATGGPLSAANTWQSVYQTPTGRMGLISHLVLWTNTASQIAVYVGTGSNGYLADPIYVPPSGWAEWADDGWHFYDGGCRRIA